MPGNEDFQSKLSRVHRLICNSKKFVRPFKIAKARTPLVKFTHYDTKIKCDVNVSNPLGVFNSEFLRWALTFDHRIKPLAACIKYWTRVHNLSGVNQISSYCLTLLVLFYLQMKKEPVFPPVYMVQNNVPPHWVGPWNMAYNERFPNTTRNRETIQELLEGFFDFYTKTTFEDFILCPYVGRVFPRSAINSNAPEFEDYRYAVKCGRPPLNVDVPLCVQDPFEQNINCATPVSGTILKRFKDYCKHALSLCVEYPSDTYRASILLKKLFTDSPPLLPPPSLLNLAGIGTTPHGDHIQICKLMPLTYETQIMNKFCQRHNHSIAKRAVVKQWGEQTFEIVSKFFTDVLLIKFYPHAFRRFQRGHIVLADHLLRVRGDTWTGREKIEFTDEESLAREIAISNELKEKNPPITLDLELLVLSNKDRDFIEIELVQPSKKDIQALAKFFQDTVQTHIRSVMKGYFALLVKKEGLDAIEFKTVTNNKIQKTEDEQDGETTEETNTKVEAEESAKDSETEVPAKKEKAAPEEEAPEINPDEVKSE